MRRYTTSAPSLVVEGVDISTYKVYVTFSQIYPDDIDSSVLDNLSRSEYKTVSLTIEPVSMSTSENDTVLACSLTQENTAMFKPGKVRTQVNWITPGGSRKATDIAFIPSFDNLLDEVKTYG